MQSLPTKGMRDFLPKDVLLREHVMNVILKNYMAWGFQRIETPCMENIHLLTSGEGGENEKMIYKILKRGEKLRLDKENLSEQDITDLGLRFDLTVPLIRFYANNRNNLIYPFKSIQIGPVWRAERPQKGRFRQLIQCDIDIIGEKENKAEIVLLSATTDALDELGFKNFVLRINNRKILMGLASHAGFLEQDYDSIFISLDKLDKVGYEGVEEELLKKGYEIEKVTKFLALTNKLMDIRFSINERFSMLPETIDSESINSLKEIITAYETNYSDSTIVFDPSLVRGMSYYTGTIFEIETEGFKGSIAGGGRYDKMLSKFTNKEEPACGFSIGFERIITILQEKGYNIPSSYEKIAVIYEDGTNEFVEMLNRTKEIRKSGNVVSFYKKKKNMKHFFEQLKEEGYQFYIYGDDPLMKLNTIK